MKLGLLHRHCVRIPLLLSALLLTMSSCLRDDLEFCPPADNVFLRVVTDYEKEHPEQYPVDPVEETPDTRSAATIGWYDARIDNVTIYVFDEDDHFVASWRGGQYTLGGKYTASFHLDEGKNYYFVAWTNNGGMYSLTQPLMPPSQVEAAQTDEPFPTQTRGEMSMSINLPESRTLTAATPLPHRHYGRLDGTPVFEGDNEYEIVLRPHTYKVNFIVRGLDADMTEFNDYDLTVTDRNARHDLSRTALPGEEPYRHTRTLHDTEYPATRAIDEIGTSMILMQIGDGTATFSLRNTTQDRQLTSAPLLEAIERAYGQFIGPGKTYADLSKMLDSLFEYDIILNYTPLGVVVEVHDWNYKPLPTPL